MKISLKSWTKEMPVLVSGNLILFCVLFTNQRKMLRFLRSAKFSSRVASKLRPSFAGKNRSKFCFHCIFSTKSIANSSYVSAFCSACGRWLSTENKAARVNGNGKVCVSISFSLFLLMHVFVRRSMPSLLSLLPILPQKPKLLSVKLFVTSYLQMSSTIC